VGAAMSVDLSFVLVNWNTRALILEALESIVDNVQGYSYEMLVVDNASEDGSADAIRSAFSRVDLIINERNLGFARAVNQALERATGRYVILLNSDAKLVNGAVQTLVAFMEANADVGVAGGQLINEDGSKQNAIAAFPSLATELLNKRVLRILAPQRYPGKEVEYRRPVDVDSLVGACMVVRRHAIDEVGGLDERYFLFMEETDWCLRMWEKGWRVCFVPHAQIIHLQGASASMVKPESKKEFYRSRYLFFEKHRGRVCITILKVGLVLRLLGEVLVDSLLLAKKKNRDRWKMRWSLLLWHLKSCPSDESLRGVNYVKSIGQEH